MKNWMKIAMNWLVLMFYVLYLRFIAGGGIEVWNDIPVDVQIMFCFGTCVILYLLWCGGKRYLIERKTRETQRVAQRVRQTQESHYISDQPDPNSILYLRPFKVDEKYMSEVEYAGKLYNSFESLICRMVEEAGSPIAIGRPGEELQPLGAHRIYATDDAWMDKVTTYFKNAKYVILYADFTPGVAWEIEKAITNYKDKLILIPMVYGRRQIKTPIFLTQLIWTNCFWFRKAHRGHSYYRKWNKLLKKQLTGIRMNDRVSAVIFENGKAIPFYTRKPNLEEQFYAINQAINAKLGVPQEKFLKKGKKPCFFNFR